MPKIKRIGKKGIVRKSEAKRLSVSLAAHPEIYMFSGDLKKVDCPQGPVFVVKDVEKAFPIIHKDWVINVGIVIDKLKSLAAKVGVDVKENVVSLYKDLDRLNGDLVTNYRATYLEFMARPCSDAALDKLSKANSKIRQATYLLRAIQFETERDTPDVGRISELEQKLNESTKDA